MYKRIILALFTAALTIGVIFSQENDSRAAKNTITLDIGPTIVGYSFSTYTSADDSDGFSTSGFGLAGQYERQLNENLSVTGRISYLNIGIGMTSEDLIQVNKIKMDFHSITAEAHIRNYPFGSIFFVDCMLGYANLSMITEGSVTLISGGEKKKQSVSYTVARDYLKIGAKLGWRIRFGNNSGFTFEPTIGYDYGIPFGDTLMKKFADKVGVDSSEIDGFKESETALKTLEDILFIGGIRITIGFGWSF